MQQYISQVKYISFSRTNHLITLYHTFYRVRSNMNILKYSREIEIWPKMLPFKTSIQKIEFQLQQTNIICLK